MAKWQSKAPYAGSGQKAVQARAQSLKENYGVDIPPNPDAPHLPSRKHVAEAERSLGIIWRGDLRNGSAKHVKDSITTYRHVRPDGRDVRVTVPED